MGTSIINAISAGDFVEAIALTPWQRSASYRIAYPNGEYGDAFFGVLGVSLVTVMANGAEGEKPHLTIHAHDTAEQALGCLDMAVDTLTTEVRQANAIAAVTGQPELTLTAV